MLGLVLRSLIGGGAVGQNFLGLAFGYQLCIGSANVDRDDGVIIILVAAALEIFKADFDRALVGIDGRHDVVELVAVEALGTIIGAMENRRAIGRLDDSLGTVRSNVDELQLDAAVDVAWLAIRIDELEAATGAVENVGHAVLGIAVRDDEKADLVARVQGDFCSALVRLQIAARAFQRCVRPENLDTRDGAIRTVSIHADGVLVTSRLAIEDDVAFEVIRDHDIGVAFNGSAGFFRN